MIAIIDYGMGNIHSVQKALESMGVKTSVTNDPDKLAASEAAILPGVGAFDDAMQELKARGLVEAIRGYISRGSPFLGICLGMQLLLEESQEAKDNKGLGIIKGGVRLFSKETGLKVPHMGWNRLDILKDDCPLFKGVGPDSFVYFCHSYYVDPADRQTIAASTEYAVEFTSVLWRESLYGVQFHPEKSQETGMKILKNFVALC